MELLKLAWVAAVSEERAQHARGVVRLVAVGTGDAKVVARAVFAFGRVVFMIGGEVGTCTLIACGGA